MAGKAQAKAKARLKVADRTPKLQSLLRARLAKASSLEEALTYVMDALERVRVARAPCCSSCGGAVCERPRR